jgi:hypothetical protein
VLPETVQGRDRRPLLGFQGPARQLKARAFHLGSQQIPLASLPHFVPGSGQFFGLFEEERLLVQQPFLLAHQQQSRVAAPHVGFEPHPDARPKSL